MDTQTVKAEEGHQPYARPTSMGGEVAWTDTPRTRATFEGDPKALAADLKRHVRGEVQFDNTSRALYAADASNYRQVPIGVVIPMDVGDIVATVAICHEHGAPILNRGRGTSLAGQTVNVAVVIESAKYVNDIIELDPIKKTARVQPGCRLDDLRDQAEKFNLTFGPDPSTHAWCTFGGMIGNNSCGVHSQMSGRTEDNIYELDVLTYDGVRMKVGATDEDELERIVRGGGRRGEIYGRMRDLRDKYADEIRKRYPDIPRRVSGYNLPELLPENGFQVARALVGTEGTCVTVLEATIRLVDSPPKRVLLVLGYEDIYSAGDHAPEIGAFTGKGLTGLEAMDEKLLRFMKGEGIHTDDLHLMPDGGGFLIAEFGADTTAAAADIAHKCMDMVKSKSGHGTPDMRLYTDPVVQEHIMEIRESGLGATAHVQGLTWPGWEDSAVPPDRIGDYLRDLQKLYDKYGYDASLYGHFGQGCIHTRINFDLMTSAGIQQYRAFMDDASDLCMRYGGSLSAEHGDGQARAEMLPKMYGADLVQAFREFKEIWDPQWKMNPGKVVDPYRIDDNLRLGTSYDPPQVKTQFQYPADNGSFSHALLRCVGVGKCQRELMSEDDTMCPSFLATHEEKHSTRGRAHLLFEMLNGSETPGPWNNEGVKEALDLCLACKGCKSDCPVHVDMATYKAEFLSHYYEEGHRRPLSAYVMGLIPWWARLASHAPKVANFFTQTPGVSTIMKRVAGLATERTLPPFADETFKDWFFRRPVRNVGKPKVMLWPDTFNNYFRPQTGKATVEVLEHAGYQVVVPRQHLCCGRPLYDYGWLGPARKLLLDILDSLRDEIRAGTPIVGMEPSCVAVFRDELVELFPNDEDAKRLKEQTFILSEFLMKEAEGYEPPTINRKAVVHGHCHHKSVMGFDQERALLTKMGLDYEVPISSCCGVAGAFGFEASHYEVSMKCGEYGLLPAVRNAEKDTLIISDGFSCQNQVDHATDRQALHVAEVLQIALRGEAEKLGAYPERTYLRNAQAAGIPAVRKGRKRLAMAACLFVGSAVTTWALHRN